MVLPSQLIAVFPIIQDNLCWDGNDLFQIRNIKVNTNERVVKTVQSINTTKQTVNAWVGLYQRIPPSSSSVSQVEDLGNSLGSWKLTWIWIDCVPLCLFPPCWIRHDGLVGTGNWRLGWDERKNIITSRSFQSSCELIIPGESRLLGDIHLATGHHQAE